MEEKEIEQLKFFNAVKVGNDEVTTTYNKNFKAYLLPNQLIKIVEGSYIAYSSLYNVVWFKLAEDSHASKQIVNRPTATAEVSTTKKSTRSTVSKAK